MGLPRLKKKIQDHTLDKIKDTVDEIQINADTNEELLRKLFHLNNKILELTTLTNRSTLQMRATQQQIQETQKELLDLTSKLHSVIMSNTITSNKEL
jgi:hypothetical protein